MGMYIAYFDETGDDGFPRYASELFVLTSVYMHYQTWKDNYNKIVQFRRELKAHTGINMRTEFHTRKFILNKKPYRELGLGDELRVDVLKKICAMIATLDIKIINVVINKKVIIKKDYDILNNALTFNVQRIENDLKSMDATHKFMIITDEGRVGKMVKTTRKIQKQNFIQSHFSATQYSNNITKLLEDPLPKNSAESLFVQLADLISFVVYLYELKKLNNTPWGNRIPSVLTEEVVTECLELLKPVLNLKAATADEYGIMIHPK